MSLQFSLFNNTAFNRTADEKHDFLLIALLALVISIGLIMVASSSVSIADTNFGDQWLYARKHSIFLAIGVVVGFVAFNIPSDIWNRYSIVFLIAGVVLLSVTLFPGIGREVNGSRRWIILGPIGVQASELAKFSFIVFFASFLARKTESFQQGWKEFFKLIFIILAFVSLLLLEPDFGSAVVLCFIGGIMMFVAGAPVGRFLLLIVSGIASLSALAVYSPYRWQRLTTFLNDPFDAPFNSGYQLVQSLIAIGRGEWFGQGLGHSVQKLHFLPEAHTDFIFSVYAEEFGFMGAVILILSFSLIVWRTLNVAMRAQMKEQKFICYFCIGVASLIAAQVFINVGVAAGMLPTKGLTLPFISAGGSSLVVSCVFVAIVLRMDWEMRQ